MGKFGEDLQWVVRQSKGMLGRACDLTKAIYSILRAPEVNKECCGGLDTLANYHDDTRMRLLGFRVLKDCSLDAEGG